jgi:allantoin racemase
MKLILIPPTKTTVNDDPLNGHSIYTELLENMRRKGQLEGLEIDVAEGYPSEHKGSNRDEEFLAIITPGFLIKIREYSEMGKYDAIIGAGSMDPGFLAARMISKIPFAAMLHSAVHIASLIGEKFSIIEMTDAMAHVERHHVMLYGLGHKLASIRTVSYSASHAQGFIDKYKKEDRINIPEVKKLFDEVLVQCIAAIENDHVDSLILGCPPLQCLEDELRQGLDKAGYDEIQLISELPAAVEMARAMVNMNLSQSSRAYPGDSLKAKPKFR